MVPVRILSLSWAQVRALALIRGRGASRRAVRDPPTSRLGQVLTRPAAGRIHARASRRQQIPGQVRGTQKVTPPVPASMTPDAPSSGRTAPRTGQVRHVIPGPGSRPRRNLPASGRSGRPRILDCSPQPVAGDEPPLHPDLVRHGLRRPRHRHVQPPRRRLARPRRPRDHRPGPGHLRARSVAVPAGVKTWPGRSTTPVPVPSASVSPSPSVWSKQASTHRSAPTTTLTTTL